MHEPVIISIEDCIKLLDDHINILYGRIEELEDRLDGYDKAQIQCKADDSRRGDILVKEGSYIFSEIKAPAGDR